MAGVTTNSSFNDANQLTSRGSTTFSYDANGNQLSSSAGAAYAYNAKNQTASLQKAGGTAQTQAYASASQFERIEKTNGGVTTQFGLARVIAAGHISILTSRSTLGAPVAPVPLAIPGGGRETATTYPSRRTTRIALRTLARRSVRQNRR